MSDDQSKRITLRLPADLHEALVELAESEGRSLNNQIVWLLKLASDPDRMSNEQLLMKVQWILREISKEVSRLEKRADQPQKPDRKTVPKIED